MLPSNFDTIKKSIKQGRKRDAAGGVQMLHPGLSVDGAMEILDKASGGIDEKSFGQNETLYNIPPTVRATPRETSVGVWHCDNAATDSSANGNTLNLTDVSYSTTKKFGTHSMLFNGTTSKAIDTISSVEPISSYLFVSAWGYTGSGKILDWPDIFVLENNGTNLVATIKGTAVTGPVTTGLTGWNYYAAQFNSGVVYIQVNDIIYKSSIVPTKLAPALYAIEWGNTYNNLLDELVIDANIVIQDDFPIYPQIGFPTDIVRYKFSDGYGTEVHPTNFLQPNMTLANQTWGNGYKGKAVVFNGATTYGTFPLKAETPLQLCMETILKFAATGAQTIIAQTSGLNLAYNGTGFVAAINGVSNPATQFSAWTPVVGTWYQISVTYDGSYKYLWINGNLYAKIAATGTVSIPASTVYVGRTVAGVQYFNGTMSSLSISRRVMWPYKRAFDGFVLGTHGFDGMTEWVL